MHAQVTKIENGYLVQTIGDDGTLLSTKALLKNTIGGVNTRHLGLSITKVLGKVNEPKKRARKARTSKAAAPAATEG